MVVSASKDDKVDGEAEGGAQPSHGFVPRAFKRDKRPFLGHVPAAGKTGSEKAKGKGGKDDEKAPGSEAQKRRGSQAPGSDAQKRRGSQQAEAPTRRESIKGDPKGGKKDGAADSKGEKKKPPAVWKPNKELLFSASADWNDEDAVRFSLFVHLPLKVQEELKEMLSDAGKQTFADDDAEDGTTKLDVLGLWNSKDELITTFSIEPGLNVLKFSHMSSDKTKALPPSSDEPATTDAAGDKPAAGEEAGEGSAVATTGSVAALVSAKKAASAISHSVEEKKAEWKDELFSLAFVYFPGPRDDDDQYDEDSDAGYEEGDDDDDDDDEPMLDMVTVSAKPSGDDEDCEDNDGGDDDDGDDDNNGDGDDDDEDGAEDEDENEADDDDDNEKQDENRVARAPRKMTKQDVHGCEYPRRSLEYFQLSK